MYPIETVGQAAAITEFFWEMSDGVRLYTRYAVPKGCTGAPIVFMRTPYEGAHRGVPHNASEYDGNLFIKSTVMPLCFSTVAAEEIARVNAFPIKTSARTDSRASST